MSMTFWCPEAPKREVPCLCKEFDQEECDPGCPGTRMASESPEFNLANGNAAGMMSLLGYDAYEQWEIKVEELADVQQRLTRAMNSNACREILIRPASSGGGPGTGQCHWVDCGNTDEQTLRRLNQMRRLVTYAQEKKLRITWG